MVASEYGKTHTTKMHIECMGYTATEDAQYNIDQLDLPLTVDQYLEKVKNGYKQVMPRAQMLPGILLICITYSGSSSCMDTGCAAFSLWHMYWKEGKLLLTAFFITETNKFVKIECFASTGIRQKIFFRKFKDEFQLNIKDWQN